MAHACTARADVRGIVARMPTVGLAPGISFQNVTFQAKEMLHIEGHQRLC